MGKFLISIIYAAKNLTNSENPDRSCFVATKTFNVLKMEAISKETRVALEEGQSGAQEFFNKVLPESDSYEIKLISHSLTKL